MATPEEVGTELAQILSAEPDKKKDTLSVVLAPKWYLDKKVVEEGQTPRLLETIRGEKDAVLIHKYEKLTKPIWQKYRSRPECHPLHFICETPLFVINDINTTFLIPDDFQFLGAVYNQSGNDSAADQFFAEALKAASADAYINTGVFRYRRGERGVIDNYYVAKKNFNKALTILHEAPLTVDEKHARRKMCAAAIDEIDYQFASFFDKFVRFIIRLLTFHFESDVHYVGPAAPREPLEVKLRQMTDSILKREFEFEKTAAQKFLAELHEKIPVAQSHLETELSEIEHQYGSFASPEQLESAVVRLGEFYTQNFSLLERRDLPAAEMDAPADMSEDVSLEDLAFQGAGLEDVDKVATKHKLSSVGELLDVAASPAIEPPSIAWLIHDMSSKKDIMEKLFNNPTVPDIVKTAIGRRYTFSS